MRFLSLSFSAYFLETSVIWLLSLYSSISIILVIYMVRCTCNYTDASFCFLVYYCKNKFMWAESKFTNDTSKDQPLAPVIPSTTTSNAESNCSSSKFEEELKVSSRLRKFTFNDLKLATRNFRPESLLGEGGFGCVFKGWIEENGTAPVKPGTGLTVAVKTLNHDGLQGHKEWLVRCFLDFIYFLSFSIVLVLSNSDFFVLFNLAGWSEFFRWPYSSKFG